MCRNIKALFNFDPPATDAEVYDASVQFVRKLSGFRKPSRINERAFNECIEEVRLATKKLLSSLETNAQPKDREEEKKKSQERALQRIFS